MNSHDIRRSGAGAIAIALCLSAPAALLAEEPAPAISRSESATATATIKAINPATREVILTTASGEELSVIAPAEVRNFDQLKVGGTITATYVRSTAITISPADKPVPKDAADVVTARAAEGDRPAGAMATEITVTGTVVGIDMANHTLKLTSPGGGEVHTVAVTKPDGQAAMSKLKVGDKITARITEGLLIAANPE